MGAFSEYAKANPYYEKKPDGRVEKWLEYKEELIESPNPLWNANLNSRALDRSFGVTNNFSAEYNPLTSLKIRGRFGITKTINESDDFLSPEDTSFDDTEELKKGSLAYQNGKNLQYEGELKWNENGDYSGVFICSGILIPISDWRRMCHRIGAWTWELSKPDRGDGIRKRRNSDGDKKCSFTRSDRI